MWQPGWEKGLAKNRYMYIHGRVPLLFIIVEQSQLKLSQYCLLAIPQFKIKSCLFVCFFKKKETDNRASSAEKDTQAREV